MESITGLRALRAVSVGGTREAIDDALAEACLASDFVERANLIFLADHFSPAPIRRFKELKAPVVPMVDCTAEGVGQQYLLFVPLLAGNNIMRPRSSRGRAVLFRRHRGVRRRPASEWAYPSVAR